MDVHRRGGGLEEAHSNARAHEQSHERRDGGGRRGLPQRAAIVPRRRRVLAGRGRRGARRQRDAAAAAPAPAAAAAPSPPAPCSGCLVHCGQPPGQDAAWVRTRGRDAAARPVYLLHHGAGQLHGPASAGAAAARTRHSQGHAAAVQAAAQAGAHLPAEGGRAGGPGGRAAQQAAAAQHGQRLHGGARADARTGEARLGASCECAAACDAQAADLPPFRGRCEARRSSRYATRSWSAYSCWPRTGCPTRSPSSARRHRCEPTTRAVGGATRTQSFAYEAGRSLGLLPSLHRRRHHGLRAVTACPYAGVSHAHHHGPVRADGARCARPRRRAFRCVQELKAASPAWVANKFVEVCGGIAMRLAPLLPVLEQHPDLIYGPAPGARWALAADDPDGAALPLHAQVDRKVLQVRLRRQRRGRKQLPGNGRGESWAFATAGRRALPRGASSTPLGCAVGRWAACRPRCRPAAGRQACPPARAGCSPEQRPDSLPSLLTPCCCCCGRHRHRRARAPQDFYRLARQVDDLLRMAKSAFLVAPQIMLTSSLHVHAVSAPPCGPPVPSVCAPAAQELPPTASLPCSRPPLLRWTRRSTRRGRRSPRSSRTSQSRPPPPPPPPPSRRRTARSRPSPPSRPRCALS